MEKVLYVRPLSITNHQTIREKRFIGEIALLLSGYSFWEIRELSSEVDQTRQNERHIVAAVDSLTKIMQRIQEHIVAIDKYFEELNAELDVLTLEVYLQSLAETVGKKRKNYCRIWTLSPTVFMMQYQKRLVLVWSIQEPCMLHYPN